MPKTTPLIKGLITGLVIIVTMLLLGYFGIPAESGAGYLIYVFYGLGVGWAIYDYSRSADFTGKFGGMFSAGFRCFIVVTVLLVIYAFIFYSLNPQIKEESAVAMKEFLVKEKKLTPDQIEQQVTDYKKGFTTLMLSVTVFQNLILGVLFSAAWSVFVLILKRRDAQ